MEQMMMVFIGEAGACIRCGEDGMYRLDPYDLDIKGEENIVCLCDGCNRELCDDI